jgi:hypothetical protein
MQNRRLSFTAIFFIVMGILILIEMLLTDAPPREDLFESATRKIDSGKTHLLTREERQRVHDVSLGWCNECGKPRRNCKHRD